MEIYVKLKNGEDCKVDVMKIYLSKSKAYTKLESEVNKYHLIEVSEDCTEKVFEISDKVFNELETIQNLSVNNSNDVYIETLKGLKKIHKNNLQTDLKGYYCGIGEKSFKYFVYDISDSAKTLHEVDKSVYDKL